jgi:tRNA(adenine34) deaminase
MSATEDEERMRLALEQADGAAAHGDVPVGAVAFDRDGRLLGSGRNRREQLGDPTAHAEIEALREAARALGRWRLDDVTLYVTLEPCVMCAGALVHARIARLVYGCRDDKAGAVDSLFVLGRDPRLNHRFAIASGVLAEPCAQRLRAFFAARRRK